MGRVKVHRSTANEPKETTRPKNSGAKKHSNFKYRMKFPRILNNFQIIYACLFEPANREF